MITSTIYTIVFKRSTQLNDYNRNIYLHCMQQLSAMSKETVWILCFWRVMNVMIISITYDTIYEIK